MELMKCKNCGSIRMETVTVRTISTFYEEEYNEHDGINEGRISPVTSRDFLRCFDCGMKYGESEEELEPIGSKDNTDTD